jgi:hypothetical protein
MTQIVQGYSLHKYSYTNDYKLATLTSHTKKGKIRGSNQSCLGATRVDAAGCLVESGRERPVLPLLRLRRDDVGVGVEEYGRERRPPPGPPEQQQRLPGDGL